MMDIFLSINNREQVIQLPIIPESFEVNLPISNNTTDTVNAGTLKTIGNTGLRSIEINSFFPKQKYSFARDNTYKGFEYVQVIEKWIARKLPIRLIVTGTPLNIAMTIDNFSYSVEDGSGDVYYSLKLSEYRFVTLNSMKR